MVTELKILNTKVDLFQDENIEIINSVISIKDISKNTNAFTRGFTVPASSNNNQLFKHYYDANITNTFDARVKINAEILLDGITFKNGFVQLMKVNIKKNKPTSYSINFSGKLTGISKALRNDELSLLDLTFYDHDFSFLSVFQGLTGYVETNTALDSITAGAVVYNLLAKKQYFYNPIETDNTQEETTANIAFDGGALTGVKWFDLRPSLRLIHILEAIEVDYGITFSRHFFGTAEFLDLYLWLNPDGKRNQLVYEQSMDFDVLNANGSPPWMDLTTDIATVERALDKQHGISFSPQHQVGYENVEYTVDIYRDDVIIKTYSDTGIIEDSRAIVTDYTLPFGSYTYRATVRTEEPFLYTARFFCTEYDEGFYFNDVDELATGSIDNTISTSIIKNALPKLKTIDFLKGIFNMFKLVVIPDPIVDDTYYVNTLEGYYEEGAVYDITKYVDFEEWDVERGTIFNEIVFKFQDPTTILNTKYLENNGTGFGDLELTLREDMNDPTSEMLDGETFTIELPFEQILYENLTNLSTGSQTSIITGTVTDEALAPISPKAHIFYNNVSIFNGNTIALLDDSDVKLPLAATNIPLHSNYTNNPIYTTTFSAEINVFDGVYMNNNLYSNHYENYISDIFNIKKRTWKYKSHLPINIITKLNLNDLLKIKGDYYRIDKFSYNLLTGETNFELINSFSTTIGGLRTSSNYLIANYNAQIKTIYIANLTGSTFNKVDLGHGTGWVSVVAVETEETQENILELSFLENTAPLQRNINLEITSTKGELTTLSIVQEAGLPRLDFSNKDNSMYTSLITLRA